MVQIFGKTVKNENMIQEEIKGHNLGNACYQVKNITDILTRSSEQNFKSLLADIIKICYS
jgi:hypothetical protein